VPLLRPSSEILGPLRSPKAPVDRKEQVIAWSAAPQAYLEKAGSEITER
jgi:hypothetical protein